MKKIAVIHTTPATIASLTELITREMGEVCIINILDDSILPSIIRGDKVELIEKHWLQYAKMAEEKQVDAILSACSTVGEIAEKANQLLEVPVYRIDEAMAEKAVVEGSHISVLATLQSTLLPTVSLVQRKADKLNKYITLDTVLVEGAYEAMMSGRKAEHDHKILEAVKKGMETSDVILLAQASMASAIQHDQTINLEKVLTSPVLGIKKLKKDME